MEETEQVYEAALEAIRGGEPAAVVTVIERLGVGPRKSGAKMIVYADGRTVGTVGGGETEAQVIRAACEAIREGQNCELVFPAHAGSCGGGIRVWIEVLEPRPTLVIAGAGHVGQALAELGAFLGYRVVVADARAELLSAERFPSVDVRLLGDPAQTLRDFPFTPHTFVVLVTPHQSNDEHLLALLAERPCAYVGLMGNPRRTQSTFERARALGVPGPWLAQVHTPVGLEIGAETPREIAVSIIAEIIAVRRGRIHTYNNLRAGETA